MAKTRTTAEENGPHGPLLPLSAQNVYQNDQFLSNLLGIFTDRPTVLQ